MASDNLHSLKDDMVAFIEGHGMRRLPGYVGEDVPSVLWEDEANADSWKDLVETAKAASAPFLTLSEVVLDPEEMDLLFEKLREQNFPDEEGRPSLRKPNTCAVTWARWASSSSALCTRA